jgi:glycosyltransferase involved in cell wall biosynthesis
MGLDRIFERMKVSITIPAYNEEKRIGNTLKTYSTYFENLRNEKKLDYELLVVINNTKDKTEDVVKKIARKNKRIIYLNLAPGGKGYAVLEGFKDALSRENDLIGFVDADMATRPEDYWDLVKGIKGFDGCIANRYHDDSKIYPPFTIRRAIVGNAFNMLVRGLLFIPYRDTQCGAKLFSRKAAKMLTENNVMSSWAFDVELLFLMSKNRFKINVIPTVWTDVGGSTLDVKKASIQMFLSVVQMKIVNSPFKRIFKPLKPIVKLIHERVK